MPQRRSPQVRPATPRDIEALLLLRRAYCRFDGVAYRPAASRHAVLRLLRSAQFGRILLLVEKDAPIGYVALGYGYSLEFDGRDGFIDELFLERAARGRGLGRLLLRAALTCARRDGIRAIHLETGRENRRAQRVYAAAGFKLRRRYMLMSRPLRASARAQSAIHRAQPNSR
jgi:GNAT superfamily N-acetyltransferase